MIFSRQINTQHYWTHCRLILFDKFSFGKKGVMRLAWVLTTDKSVKNSSLVRLSRRRFMPCFAAGTN